MQNLVSSSIGSSVTNVPLQFYRIIFINSLRRRKTWLQAEKEIESWLDKVSEENYIE